MGTPRSFQPGRGLFLGGERDTRRTDGFEQLLGARTRACFSVRFPARHHLRPPKLQQRRHAAVGRAVKVGRPVYSNGGRRWVDGGPGFSTTAFDARKLPADRSSLKDMLAGEGGVPPKHCHVLDLVCFMS